MRHHTKPDDNNNTRQDTDDIRISEYDPNLISTTDDGAERNPENLNYYQRIRQVQNGSAYSSQNSNRRSYAESPAPDPYKSRRYDSSDSSSVPPDDDEDEDYIGDDYDFGFIPRKKKKRKNNTRDYYNNADYYQNSDSGHRHHHTYEGYPERKHRRRKRHPVRRFFVTLLIILLILLVLVLVLLHLAFSRLNRVDPVADTTADEAAAQAGVDLYKESGVMNILLIGQDARDGETQTRSDTMIIASLNTKTHQIVLTSLMRDMYVPIAGYSYEKLNAAYALGGMETLDETVQENFGIDINGNAVVDFDSFLSALTAVGNLNISLTQEEADYLNTYPGLGSSDDTVEGVVWNLKAGVNNMTPAQVLAYSRMRYVGNSDWDRTARQRTVIQTALDKIKKNPVTLFSVMNEAAPSITTDMTDPALTKAFFYALFSGSDMTTNLIPGEGMYTMDEADGMAVLTPDLDACHQALIRYIYHGDGSQGTVAANKDVNDDTVTDSGTDNDTFHAGTEAEHPNAGEWPQSAGNGTTNTAGSDEADSGDYITDPRTGEPALDADHDGIPDYWGDTW